MPERERGILSAYGLGRGWLQPVVPVRDIWLFGEVVCMMNWIVLGTAVGVPQRDFLKGKLRPAGQEPCAQLPCQQKYKIESSLLLLNTAGQGDQRSAQQRDFWPLPSTASKLEAT